MKRILILGATGNIASIVARELADKPNLILRLTSSRPEGADQIRSEYPAAEVMVADWYDLESLTAAIRDVDRIFVNAPDFVTDESVATPNLIAAVKANGGVELVARLIGLQPIEDEEMTEEWLATKTGSGLHAVAVPLLKASDLPVAFVNVAAWLNFNLPWFVAESVRTSRTMPMPYDARRSWVSESDIAEICAKILTGRPGDVTGETFVVTGCERLSHADVARLISAEIGEPVEWVDSEVAVRAAVAEYGDTLATYMSHECRYWDRVELTDTGSKLLGRELTTLQSYIHENRELFL